MPSPVYTASEKAKRARLLIKGAKNAYGDTDSIERQIDRIDEKAADRGQREYEAHQRLLNDAKNDAAKARVAERCAKGSEAKREARRDRQDAEKRLRTVERAGR